MWVFSELGNRVTSSYFLTFDCAYIKVDWSIRVLRTSAIRGTMSAVGKFCKPGQRPEDGNSSLAQVILDCCAPSMTIVATS